ncbi:hypothetical protein DM02DRAFT_613141 [Periconia macrospinosa]|uniref:DNA glycosylase n=1 Tax=Periconia macrospinosa TaxID=97972 RepID=A0A2V1DVP7_9PLEO|nr:hypothetical protein DM02DRAFT_613141 [Periconia macrospinosa]
MPSRKITRNKSSLKSRLSHTPSLEQACASLDRASVELQHAALDISAAAVSLPNSFNPIVTTHTISRKRRKLIVLHNGAAKSPYFAQVPSTRQTIKPPETKQQAVPKAVRAPAKSPYFPEPFSREIPLRGLSFELQPSLSPCNLIQERICNSLYALVIQAILWNKTHGSFARPILWDFLVTYPTVEALAVAPVDQVEQLIRKLGLQRARATRFVEMANVWVASPPCAERRYQRRDYPYRGDGRDVKKGVAIGLDSPYEGWEIAHLPGIGEYALDSYRIFGRDRLRGLHGKPGVEPEWKRTVPGDKELGPFVKWMWAQEGWDFNVKTGTRVRLRFQNQMLES